MSVSKQALIRSTFLFILVGLAALLLIVGASLWLVGQSENYASRVADTRELRGALIDLKSLIQDAETGQRGYLLTNEPNYLQPYESAVSSVGGKLTRLQASAKGERVLLGPISELGELIGQKMAELKETVGLARAGNRDAAIAVVRSDRGKNLMDAARRILDPLITEADTRLSVAVEEQRQSISALRWITIFGAGAIIVVVGGSAWVVADYTRQLVAAQREMAALNAGLEERVRERTADLARANEEIQKFAYIVTHDLRAPLVNIMGFTSELEASLAPLRSLPAAGEPDAGRKTMELASAALAEVPEALDFIRSSTRKMDGLISAILKLSREGRRTLRPESIDLAAVLSNAADAIQHHVSEADGEITINAKVPRLTSDLLAVEQIFGNLLDNAVKYRRIGIPLRIDVAAKPAAGQRILVEVRDNGRGIAAHDFERVFELFRRSGTQDQVGEGIGLAHVRTMLRNLGGDISVASELGKGTTFTIVLPQQLRIVPGVVSGG